MPDRFPEFRPDGWPYCPQCTNDELYSHVMLWWDGKEPRPTLEECLAGTFACYACGWDETRTLKRIPTLEETMRRVARKGSEDG